MDTDSQKKVVACMVVILLALGALGIGLARMQGESERDIAKTDQKRKLISKADEENRSGKTSKDDSKKKRDGRQKKPQRKKR